MRWEGKMSGAEIFLIGLVIGIILTLILTGGGGAKNNYYR
jgi:hypothetical protein